VRPTIDAVGANGLRLLTGVSGNILILQQGRTRTWRSWDDIGSWDTVQCSQTFIL